MADERDIRARLEIERTGDTGALKDAADEISALPEAAMSAEEGLARLDAAMDRLADAKGPVEQKKALEELARTFVEVGRVAAESFESGSVEAEAMGRIIDEIEAKVATFGDGLESALARGHDAWAKLEKSMASGGEGIQQRLVALQQAIRDYTAELERAEAAGREVTVEQRAELDRLNEAYRNGAKAAGEYRAAQQQVQRDLDKTTEAAGGQGRAIRSVDDLLRTSGSSWSRYAVNVGAAVGTFTAFYEIGTKVRDVLNDITDGGFDDGVQKWLGFDAIAAQLTGTLDANAEAASRLQNNLRILRAEGIDPAGRSVTEIDELVEQLGQTMQKQRREASESESAHRKWAESMGLSAAALDKESAALEENARLFAEANKGILGTTQLRALFGEQIQGILDEYARLGREAPEGIRALAAEWSILPTAAADARDKHKALVDQIRRDITGTAEEVKRDLTALLAALPEALAGIDFRNIQILDPEQFARAREMVQGFLADFREAGEQIPAELARAATSLGLFVAQSEGLAGASNTIAAGADAAEASLTRFVETTDESGRKIRTLVNDVSTVTPAIAGFTEAVRQQSPAVEELLAKYGEGGTRARELATGATEAAAATDAQAAAAGGAAQATGEMADQAKRLAEGDTTSGIAAMTAEFELARAGVQALTDLAVGIPEAFKTAGAASAGWAAPIIAELKTIQQEAAATLVSLQAVAGGGDGAAAPAPPPEGLPS